MPLFNFKCTACNSEQRKLVRDNNEQHCAQCNGLMVKMLPTSINTSVYVAPDKHRGTQIRKNLNTQLKERMTKYHDRYELEEKIDKFGTDDAQQFGWFKKVKKV